MSKTPPNNMQPHKLSELKNYSRHHKRTKIVATIGPASEKPATLKRMIAAGMNVCRLNFSHGTFAAHARLIKNIRAAARATNEPVAILQDLSGPKIRVGDLPPAGVELKAGKEIMFANDGTINAIPFTYKNLSRDIKPGDRILLDDGLLEVSVTRVQGKEIFARVVVPGVLLPHKGMNVPTASLSVAALTPKDKKDLAFGLTHDVDIVSLSFVRSARDVKALRRLIAQKKKGPAPLIVAKIEKHEAINDLPAIVAAVDGIMVARGDLALETAPEDVPVFQKRIISECRAQEKFVIVATEMLASMSKNPRPTRAEVSDVANAVIDKTDAVMLSGESATGKYPVETIEMMKKICVETEASEFDDIVAVAPPALPAPLTSGVFASLATSASAKTTDIFAEVAALFARLPRVAAICLSAKDHEFAPALSRLRPETQIVVGVPTLRIARRFNIYWGLRPVVAKTPATIIAYLKKHGFVKKGERVVFLTFNKHMGTIQEKEVII